MANIASPPVEVAPGAVTIKFAIHTGTSSVSAIISPRCGVHFNNIANEISGSGHVVQYPVNEHQQDQLHFRAERIPKSSGFDDGLESAVEHALHIEASGISSTSPNADLSSPLR